MLADDLQLVYDKLLELTDGEEDEELRVYNDNLLDSICVAKRLLIELDVICDKYDK